MIDPERTRRFERVVLPHLDSAFNLARWITGRDSDAEDVVQEACVRALSYFDGFRGGSSRSWLLAIVRHTCLTWLAKNRPRNVVALDSPDLDEDWDNRAGVFSSARPDDPETALLDRADTALLNRMIADLPVSYREVTVLREIEELSYQEIAEVMDIPVGTVMSRLSRARQLLQRAWQRRRTLEAGCGM